MPRRFACPHCDAVLKLSDTLSPRTKVRCPECDAVFTPAAAEEPEAGITRQRGRAAPAYDDEDDYRPRGRRRQPQGTSTALVVTLVAVGVGALVLVGGGVTAGLYWMRKSAPVAQNTAPPMPQPQPQQMPPFPPGWRPPGLPGAGGPAQPPIGGAPGNNGTQVGQMARDIDGEDIDGKKFKLSDYRGKVVLLDFWGNW